MELQRVSTRIPDHQPQITCSFSMIWLPLSTSAADSFSRCRSRHAAMGQSQWHHQIITMTTLSLRHSIVATSHCTWLLLVHISRASTLWTHTGITQTTQGYCTTSTPVLPLLIVAFTTTTKPKPADGPNPPPPARSPPALPAAQRSAPPTGGTMPPSHSAWPAAEQLLGPGLGTAWCGGV